MDIRKYQEKDRENLRQVCIETSAFELKNEVDEKVLTLLYIESYIDTEPENCFVAVDENDEALGYIVCAPDFDRYYKNFMDKYFKQIFKLKPFTAIRRWIEFQIDKPLKKHYPAHLHINLFAKAQKKGLGTKLVNALYAHLKELGVPAVYLRCGKNNEKGMNFYKKYGFTLKSTKISGLFVLEIV